MTKTKLHATPDGAITFEMIPFETLRADILYRRVIDGMGGFDVVGKMFEVERTRATSFATILAHTKSITFNKPEPQTPAHEGFAIFWEFAKAPVTDYSALWEMFLDYVDYGIYEAWCDAYNATRGDVIKAAPEIAPGSAKSAETDFLSQSAAEPQ